MGELKPGETLVLKDSTYNFPPKPVDLRVEQDEPNQQSVKLMDYLLT